VIELRVLTFLVALSILIVLHEFGHYIVARRNGVHVNEFSVGMGPRVLGWKSPRTGTQYSLRALPIGGYCAMYGEDAAKGEAEQQREFREDREEHRPPDDANFQAKSAWQRLRIILAGPVMNLALAYVILLVSALAFGLQSSTPETVIGDVTPHSPAAAAGFKPGDRLVAVDSRPVLSGEALINEIHSLRGRRILVEYVRDGRHYGVNVTPVRCGSLSTMIEPRDREKGCIGFTPVPAFSRVGFGRAVVGSFNDYGAVADGVFMSVALLATDFRQYAPQVTGVVGFGQAAVTIQSFGGGYYLRLMATISFALGIFNLLPIPALDGGRLAFIIAEILRGKPVDPEKEGMVHFAGFVVLMVLMLVIAAHDIARIASGQGVL
jgi:regulator of sigma E protease